jgi:SAM-dependent methyltransferase
MKEHSWEKAYSKKRFQITTSKPSILVEKYSNKLSVGDHVLDVGCGNGRNSMYLAGLGCRVDSFDVADLNWVHSLSFKRRNRIFFTKSDIARFPFVPMKYDAVVITRVIQYLNKKELKYLLGQVHQSLKPSGFLLLSFSAQGGIFDRDEIQVPKYKYSIEEIRRALKKGFFKVLITKGSGRSQNVNYKGSVVSYDIYASDPRASNTSLKLKKSKMVKTDLDKPIMELVLKSDHETLGIWAADCDERTLHYFEEKRPKDHRPRKAIEALRMWVKTGVFRMSDVCRDALAAHAAARDVEHDDAARSAARAAGQAMATAHVRTHSVAAAIYAATAVRDATGSMVTTDQERAWQYEHLRNLRTS